MPLRLAFPFFALLPPVAALAASPLLAPPDLVLLEQNGFVSGEAEHFIHQERAERRAWRLVAPGRVPDVAPDGDGPHLAGASGGAYLEALPDVRRTHYEPIVIGESFSNTGGAIAVLSYRVRFTTPGRYYVWVRTFSTGGEDNGIHVGLDDAWPESGLRWQTSIKNQWAWDSRQRTDAEPRGERHKLFLDVPSAGEHWIRFSMREDGFEFDRWLLTTDRAFVPEGDGGPPSPVAAGRRPPPFALPAGYTDPVDPPRPHDGSGLAMPEGDFRPGGRVTLVLNTDPADPIPADANVRAIFTHESGAPVVGAKALPTPDGRWRATFGPDRAGQWYFTVECRDAAGAAVARYDNLSGVFPVSAP